MKNRDLDKRITDSEQDSQDAKNCRSTERNHGVSRRTFLRRVATLGGMTLLAGCAGPQAAPPTGPTSVPAAYDAPTPTLPVAEATVPEAGMPQRGGTYRILSSGDFRSFDPPAADGGEDWWCAGMMLYNMLYFFDKDCRMYADLAGDLPTPSDDRLRYTIPLRHGVRFHNGREMTAEDVKFSLERQLWPEVYSWGKTYMDSVVGYQDVIDGKTKDLAGVKVIDPHTIEVALDKPQAVFPAILSMSMNAIIPKHETQEAGQDWGVKTVIGTGPFKFVEWVQGQHAVFERNPDYFKPDLPYLDRIEYRVNVEASVQMLRYEAGETELIRDIPAAERERVFNDPAMGPQVRVAPAVSIRRLGIHHKTKPFDDIRVRQAVAMALNKEVLARAEDAVLPPLEGFYSHPMLQYDPNFKSKYPYDPDAARAMMAEAGFAGGVKGVTLQVNSRTQRIGELIQADLKAIGIETELNVASGPKNREKVRSGEHALFLYGWSASFPDAFDFVSSWTTCAATEIGYNDGMYCNQTVDDLLAQAERLPEQSSERLKIYGEIEDIVINQDVGFVGLYNGQSKILGSKKVHDDFASSIYYNAVYLESAWMEQ